MANIIIPKRSTVAGKVPVTGDLVTGEIAINLTDKKLYSKDGSGAIVEIGGGSVDLLNVTTGIASPDYIQFDTSATNTAAVGKLYWDAGEGSFLYTLSGGNVTQNLHPGSELVYNGTGAALTKGQVVYLSGAQGQRPSVALALATSDTTSARTLGIVAETIANGAEGWITTSGILQGFDTSGFTAGQQLYLSGTTAGGMTATKPSAPTHLVYVARCLMSHATTGRILVGIQNGYELNEIHDVAISAPSTGQTIVYNSTTSLWSNGTLPVAGGGTGATSLSSGYVLKGNGTSAVSASIIYDNGTNVGVGTSSPTSKFYVSGAAVSTGNSDIIAIDQNSVSTGFYSSLAFRQNSTNIGARITSGNPGSYKGFLAFETSQQTVAGTTTIEAMRINEAGNVGIGTSSPSAKLTVSNAGAAGYEVNPTGGVGGGATVATYNRSTMGYTSLTTYSSTMTWYANGTRAMDLDVSGRLSVGNAGPLNTNMISAYGTNQNGFVAQVSNNVYSTFQGFNSTTTLTFQVDGSGNGYFAGNLGVGTSSPGAKLDVNGQSNFRNAINLLTGSQAYFYNPAGNAYGYVAMDSGNILQVFNNAGSAIAFSTNATERMRIDSSGNVGIGTSSPGATLTVATNTTSHTGMRVINSSTTQYAGSGLQMLGPSAAGTQGGAGIYYYNTNVGGTQGAMAMAQLDNNGSFQRNLAYYDFNYQFWGFLTSSTERMRIDSSGNVGIGTNSPTVYSGYTTLEIDNATNGGILSIKKAGSVVGYMNGSSGLLLLAQSNDLKLTTTGSTSMQFSTNATERMRIDSSGLVGVGTASPATRLHVYSGGTDEVARFESTGNPYISLYDTNVRQAYLYSSTATVDLMVDVAKDLKFGTNGTERMRIDSSGRVGIGTTSPSYKLDVQQSTNDTTIRSYTSTAGAWLQAHSATAGYAGVKLTSGTANWSAGMTYGNSTYCISYSIDGSSNRFFTIDTSGNVGIGTSSPSAKLHIVGDINLDGISVRDTATITTTATTQVALATFAGATYDSAEIIIKAKQSTAVHITKLLVVYDGTTASATEFGTVLSGSSLFTTDVDVSSGSVRVLITPASATSTVFKASYELITA